MTFDEGFSKRLRELFVERPGVPEKMMFGGLAFMLRSHMLAGIMGASLKARVGPDEYAEDLKRPYAREMDFTGKPMKGYVYVDPAEF